VRIFGPEKARLVPFGELAFRESGKSDNVIRAKSANYIAILVVRHRYTTALNRGELRFIYAHVYISKGFTEGASHRTEAHERVDAMTEGL
jgi:hypothetical protein